MSEIIPSPPVEKLWELFKDKEYRRGFSRAHVGGFLAAQIYSMRIRLGWNQTTLGEKVGATQPQVSGWESTCENVNLTTLHRLAEAFDVALIVKLVPFSELAREAVVSVPDRNIPSFDGDSPHAAQILRKPLSFTAASYQRTAFVTASARHRVRISASPSNKSSARKMERA